MANTICNNVASYLTDLGATHAVCSALGDTLTFAENLFIGISPATDIDTIAILPYGGSPPNMDNIRQEASIQIRTKTDSRYRGLGLQQEIINFLHTKEIVGVGKIFAKQSVPILFDVLESGEHTVMVSNFDIKYIKV